MGTRFLLTSDSPVPDAVKQVYLAAGLDGTVVTWRVDGSPLRVLRTTMVDRLEGEGPGGSGLGWGQVLMAANTPVLLRAAMVDGRTDLGLMSSGQVAGLIDDLPSCAELIESVMAEAGATLDRLAAVRER
jgi:NAD(P)H-dependent flavin oxidoreductase YrpB (nitropropane dioxygenase family)